MSSRLISLLVFGLLLISVSAQDSKKDPPAFEHPGFESKITLAVTHPGFESKKAEEHTLNVKLDPDRNPILYAMEVRSVFCSDEKCDVITLNMKWDSIGRFIDYQLPESTKLTKYEHEPFTKEDYTKFDKLMQNRSSLLGELGIEQLIVKQKDPEKNTKKGTKEKPKDVAGKGDALQKVDAISGATPSYIQEEVVEGAAYTCYTMWHWANGNTAGQIRAHAQASGSPEWLAGLLSTEDGEEVDFALEAIAKRSLHDEAIQQQAIAAAGVCSTQGFRLLIDYLSAANPKPEARYAAYQQVMQTAHDKARVMLLEHILKLKDAPPPAFFEATAELLPQFERFYELQLFLSLAEKHAPQSDKLLGAVAKMLEHDNFFFSRRAHAFLKQRKLPAELQTALQAYEKKHEGKL